MARTSIQNANASLVFSSSTDVTKASPATGLSSLVSSFAIGGWIKNAPDTTFPVIMSLWGGGGNPTGLMLYFSISTRRLTAKAKIGGTQYDAVVAATRIPIGDWCHIALTFDGTTLTGYMNGLPDGTQVTVGGAVATTNNKIELGKNAAGGNTFKGSLLKMFVGPYMNAEQIMSVYQRNEYPSGMVAVYPLSEGAGTIAYDTSGNGNNGTITSGTWTTDTPSKTRKTVNGNLVYNGDFEIAPVVNVAQTTASSNWLDGTSTGSTTNNTFGWRKFNYTGSQHAYFDSTEKYLGQYSLRLSTLGTGATIGVTNATQATLDPFTSIPCTPSTAYTLKFWMKTNVVSGSATSGAFLRISGGNVSDSTKVKTTTDWTQYTVTVTTGGAISTISIEARITGNDGTGTLIMDAWFDDITLTPTTPTTRTATTGPYRRTVENLVENGDFEYAPAFTAAQTSMSRWIDGTAAGAATVNDYGVRVIGAAGVSAQFDSGYLKLVVPANKWIEAYIGRTGYGAIPNYIPILPSTSYTVTMRMKTEYISGDALGARITVYVSDGAFGGVTSYATSYIKTTTDWTTYSVTFTTGATVRYARVACSTSTDTGAANLSMTAYYDDIVLTKTTPDARTLA